MRLRRGPDPDPGRPAGPVGDGLESVWDYPRPPRLERVSRRIRVEFGGRTIADTTGAFRVLETSHPPNYYLPPADVESGVLVRTARSSYCEWKGMAHYFDVVAGDSTAVDGAWGYDTPNRAFRPITGFVAFYAGAMTRCLVDEVEVVPQPGGFYGGWITPELVGPFKGGPGTTRW
jgi:uncharacterized protein (DUF427 family)